MAKKNTTAEPEFKKKNPDSKVAFVKGKWVEVTPERAAEIQKEAEAIRAQQTVRHERLGKNQCPECGAPTPKHERLRACTVTCTKCKHLYATYPGI